MGYRRATGPNGEVKYFRSATDENGNQHFLEIQKSDIPAPDFARLEGGTYTPPDGDQAGRRELLTQSRRAKEAGQQQQVWQEAVLSGPVDREKYRMARDMPWYKKFATQAMLETQKLHAGLQNWNDFIEDVTPKALRRFNPLGIDIIPEGEVGPLMRTANRVNEQAAKDEMDKYLHQEAGSAGLGAAVPYLLSGRYASAPFERGVNAIVNRTVQATGQAANKSKGLAGQAVRRLSRAKNRYVKQVGDELQENVMDPIEKFSRRSKNRKSIILPERQGALGAVGGAAGLGAVEGGLHYDNSATEGMGASTLGTMLGRLGGRFLEPSLARPQYARNLEFWDDVGYKFNRGEWTGDQRWQKRAANARDSDRYYRYVNEFDNANQKILTDVAGDAIGLDTRALFPNGSAILPPKALKDHMESIRNQYRQMEADTVGRVDLADYKALKESMDDIPESDRKVMDELMTKLRKTVKPPFRGATGRFQKGTFDGTEYQTLREELKSRANQMFKNGNDLMGRKVTDMVKFLDKGIEQGMDFGGKFSSAEWKDLNERYAMSKILMNNGLDDLGRVDIKKIGQWVESNDAERLLLDEGGRIKNFHQMARLDQIKRVQARPGLTNQEEVGGGVRSTLGPLSSPAATDMSVKDELLARLELSPFPGVTGYLGWLPGYNRGTTSALGRAVAQGEQLQNPTIALFEYMMNDTPEYWEKRITNP